MAFRIVNRSEYGSIKKHIEQRLLFSGMILNVLTLHEKDEFPMNVKVTAYLYEDVTNLLTSDNALVVVTLNPPTQGLPNFVLMSNPGIITEQMSQAVQTLFDWTQPTVFGGMDEAGFQVLKDICSKQPGKNSTNPCHLFSMSVDEALKLSVESSESVEVRELSLPDTHVVNSYWKESKSTPDTLAMLQASMQFCGSGGVYLNSTQELTSGAVVLFIGTINALFTKVEHRKKGYGSLAMKRTAKSAAEKGLVPSAHVEFGNEASKVLMERSGFSNCGTIQWIRFIPE